MIVALSKNICFCKHYDGRMLLLGSLSILLHPNLPLDVSFFESRLRA